MSFNNNELNTILEDISKKTFLIDKFKDFTSINKNNFEYNNYSNNPVIISRNDETITNDLSDLKNDNREDFNTTKQCKLKDSSKINDNVITENKMFDFLNIILPEENYVNTGDIDDSFIASFLTIIKPEIFIALNKIKKNEFIRAFKNEMYIVVNENNMYEKFNYKRLKATKTFINKTYQENLNSQDINIQIVSDHYNLGILVIKNGFMTIYDNDIEREKRLWIILIKDKGNYYPILKSGKSVYKYDRIKEIINYFDINFKNWKMTKLENISKYSSGQLQEIASNFNIELKKNGKNGMVNKLKKELYDEINDIIV